MRGRGLYISESCFTAELMRQTSDQRHFEDVTVSGVLETWPVPNKFTDTGDYTEEYRGYVSVAPSTATRAARARRCYVRYHDGKFRFGKGT